MVVEPGAPVANSLLGVETVAKLSLGDLGIDQDAAAALDQRRAADLSARDHVADSAAADADLASEFRFQNERQRLRTRAVETKASATPTTT